LRQEIKASRPPGEIRCSVAWRWAKIELKALGFPTEMFTVLYAIARTAGWIAHWKEMIDDPSQRIGRPRQLYTGATERTYVPMEVRS
jgi:citrate synthase